MGETRLPRTGVINYGAGTDSLSRADWNEQAAAIEARAVVYDTGTRAARTAAGKAGRLYRTTDTGELFWDTGTTWVDALAVLQALQVVGAFSAGSISATSAFIGSPGVTGVAISPDGQLGVVGLFNRSGHPTPIANAPLLYSISNRAFIRNPDGSLSQLSGPP